MMRDVQRGWAFTRALLGLNADEIHVCGEAAGVSLVEELCMECIDDFEVVHYNRLTRLKVLSRGVGERLVLSVFLGSCLSNLFPF